MILHRTAVSNSETDSSQAEEEDSPQFLLPAQEPGNLLTGLRKKHQPSISPSVGTLLIPWRDQQLTSKFDRSVSQHWKKKALDQEIWAETCYNILSVSKMYRQPDGEKREDKAQTEIKWVNNFSSLRTHTCSS